MTEAPRPQTNWDPVEVEESPTGRTGEEPMGTKEKFWVLDSEEQLWLCKLVRVIDGESRGEDWAEWLVHHLAGIVGIPTARVRPASYEGRRGIISLSVVAQDERLVHGNELLREVDSGYDEAEPRENPGYTLAAVRAALRGIAPPTGYPELTAQSAFDVWAAYLLLDAWVAGRDRHHQNWAVIEGNGTRRLAPSFDHGNALGFQETEDRRRELSMSPNRLLRWARRGKSPHISGRPGLVELAHGALATADPLAADHWRQRLASVDMAEVSDLVQGVPAPLMSDAARTFCIALLELNRRRLLDGD